MRKTYGGGNEDGVVAVFSSDGARLLHAAYLGGSGEEMVRSIPLGLEGSICLVGNTSSPDFPVTSTAVRSKSGGGGGDVFAVKPMRE